MKKRILSVFLALCMIVGLLPTVAMPHAHAAATSFTTIFCRNANVTVTKGGEAKYFKNEAGTATDITGQTFDTTVVVPATATDDWNAKLIWHAEDAAPTLYLDGLVYDCYNEATGCFMRSGSKPSDPMAVHPINPQTKLPLTIVLQNRPSTIMTFGGIASQGAITIKSEENTKLTAYTYTYFLRTTAADAHININNANLDVTVAGYRNDYPNAIYATSSNINITGGTVSLQCLDKSNYPIRLVNSGNIYINGGADVNVNTKGNAYYAVYGAAPATGKIYVDDAKLAIYGQYGIYNVGGAYTNGIVVNSCATLMQGENKTGTDAKNVDELTAGYGVGKYVAIIPNHDTSVDTFVEHPAAEPEVGKEGNTLYYSCSKCNKYFAEEYGEEIEEGSWILPAIPDTPVCEHTNVTEYEAKPSTCKELGNNAYYYCNGCEKYFSDETCETEIAVDSWVLTEYGACVPNEDDGDCTTAVYCSVCGKETTPAEASHTGGEATCKALAKCETCGKEYGDYVACVPNADDGDCTTAITCSVCGKETTPAAASHTGGEATCKALAKCETCGKEYGVLAEHSYTTYIYNNDATYNADGTKTASCDYGCGKQDTITAEGTMLPGAVAKIGDTKYGTLQDAIDAAAADATVTLIGEINLAAEGVTIDKNLTINLNGQTVNSLGDVFVVTAGTLTIDGEGNVNAETDGVGSSCAVWANGGHVIIKNGTYSCGGDNDPETDPAHQNDMIYTKNGGTVVVEGGYFKYTDGVWTLNENDKNRGTLTVTGGEFEGFDPMNCGSEGFPTNFLADKTQHTKLVGDVYSICTYDPLDAVRENVVVGNCTTDASYDLVVYCECTKKLSSEHFVETAPGHTESELAAEEATCTKPGKTAGVECSVCHEVLTAQEEIPALGHAWTEEGTCANGCGSACPVINVNGNKLNVVWDDTGATKMHIFYLGDKVSTGEVNPTKWTAVWNAATAVIDGSPYEKGYIVRTTIADMNAVELTANGDYVMFLTYIDENNTEQTVSKTVTVNVLPTITADENGKININLNDFELVRAYVFYLKDTTGINTGRWSEVKPAAVGVEGSPYGTTGFQTYWAGSKYYGLDKCVLSEVAGTYVVFVTYKDAEGNDKQVSESFVVE